MDLDDTPDEASFRAEVRGWLAAHKPHDLTELSSVAAIRDLPDVAPALEWSAKLAEAGYAGITWPAEHGGRGAPLSYQAIFLEEAAAMDAPVHLGGIGLNMIGPTIIEYGTPEQKQHLAHILDGSEIWCQGFSEPGAGSDLAGVRTRATLDGDHYVINGQKVWSSFAHIAQWCMLLVRSEAGSERHRGLTMILVDLDLPGVEIRPIRELTGDAVFNEVFYNDVRVPVSHVLGAVGDGWNVAMTTLGHERATLGFSLVGSLEALLRRAVALVAEVGVSDPLLLDRLAAEVVEVEALKLTNRRFLATLEDGAVPGAEGSAIKLRWSLANQRLTSLIFDMLGPAAVAAPEEWRYQRFRSRANTIEAGTNEVLRGILAERVLGLPRSR
ncbi:acyl-CoA dehydrogenase [Nocardioides sp. zg-579]|uniref:Acyl-CoA dehydrogenase n=1 Tax=Nocardioides marmotae TaxID=2663857 RepID=A0A6I3J491_9ACTN|nr:acyl-CoA dehydrogenase family protein [Nocardioides marmotae]MCR6030113.1 acyl-CoA dehydrogenase [Gordonia jinghuaiqii]MTB93744.1 acyl-CoA dehydrogenase [Nocardioides marmotae]QKE00083.1 acyl-CoA dehydrogenase [Nocardioides marmotae]